MSQHRGDVIGCEAEMRWRRGETVRWQAMGAGDDVRERAATTISPPRTPQLLRTTSPQPSTSRHLHRDLSSSQPSDLQSHNDSLITPLPESPSPEEVEDEVEEEEQSDASEEPVLELPKKRRGRPPRNSLAEPPPLEDDDEPESPVPGSPTAADSPSGNMIRRRGRGRPSTSGIGSRGRGRGGPSHTTTVPADKFGNEQNVKNNEIDLPEDPSGERKVDKNGNLLGGRQYRCRTFTMMNCGDQLYMLSTEPARCAGFRDSYLFFQRHKQLYKIICNEDEKFDLINRNIIPHSYKGRAIGVCTARSVFREFGARMIVAGRKVTDDYYEQVSRDRGDVEGEIADPDDRLPPPGVPYNQNQYVAWHGASSVYHNTAPAIPEVKTSGAGGLFTVNNPKKKKLTSENFMTEIATNTAEYNNLLTEHRARTWNGIYEPHTNQMHYPSHLQPSAATCVKVSDTMLPADEFFDHSVPAKGRNYPSKAAYTVEYQLVTPSSTLSFAPGQYSGGRSGSLMSIDPSIYADQPEHIKAAILAQIEKEKSYLGNFGIKPLASTSSQNFRCNPIVPNPKTLATNITNTTKVYNSNAHHKNGIFQLEKAYQGMVQGIKVWNQIFSNQKLSAISNEEKARPKKEDEDAKNGERLIKRPKDEPGLGEPSAKKPRFDEATRTPPDLDFQMQQIPDPLEDVDSDNSDSSIT
ncbi:hypothetical protein H072_1637 [Dactylellina haptotyla CBS 200.50]|uniref:Uncharacterized protein n=1 Tax=Dactylellina haptotyla (strain CBS 200.50) TaxID=1284197 RepID=S8C9R3_DACHA|nr:hypothetical protein H072_1637 [Dactylellina haptotyla CBS 200.50]